jgi:hypothetical protein
MALAGCGERFDEYWPVSAVARGGFAGGECTAAEMQGREARLWGLVDHGNLYGDADTKRILGDR